MYYFHKSLNIFYSNKPLSVTHQGQGCQVSDWVVEMCAPKRACVSGTSLAPRDQCSVYFWARVAMGILRATVEQNMASM